MGVYHLQRGDGRLLVLVRKSAQDIWQQDQEDDVIVLGWEGFFLGFTPLSLSLVPFRGMACSDSAFRHLQIPYHALLFPLFSA